MCRGVGGARGSDATDQADADPVARLADDPVRRKHGGDDVRQRLPVRPVHDGDARPVRTRQGRPTRDRGPATRGRRRCDAAGSRRRDGHRAAAAAHRCPRSPPTADVEPTPGRDGTSTPPASAR